MNLVKKTKWFLAVLACLLCFNAGSVSAAAAEPAPDVIPVPAVNLYQETVPDGVPAYSVTIPLGMNEVVKKIEVPCKGKMFAPIVGVTLDKSVDVGVYTDEACTSRSGYSAYISSANSSSVLKTDFLKKGTYYIKFSYNYGTPTIDGNLTIQPYIFSGEDKTLVNKEEMGTYSVDYNEPVYHKITTSKAGYIKLEAASFDAYSKSVTVTLCNSKKEEIGNYIYLTESNDNTAYFGLAKGTYYIKIKNSSPYKIKYTATAVTDQSGASKAKAVSVPKNVTKKGLILSTDATKKSDWFKIKLTKKQKIRFNIAVKSTDRISFKIVPASSKTIIFGDTVSLSGSDTMEVVSQDSFVAGTYYIQVSKSYGEGSGYYTITGK